MSDTPETQEAAERWRQGKINIFDEMARLERERDEARRGIRLMAQNAEVWKERADQARRELDIQLESIKFHMERVPVREHPLRVDDAPLQDSGAEPQPLREGEPSDFCGAIRRMRDAERERDEANAQMCQAIGHLSDIAQTCQDWLDSIIQEPAVDFIKAIRDWAKRKVEGK